MVRYGGSGSGGEKKKIPGVLMELVAEWWRWLMLFVIDAFFTRPRDMLGVSAGEHWDSSKIRS